MVGIYEGVKFGDMEKGIRLLDQVVQELGKEYKFLVVVEGCIEIFLVLKDKDYGNIKLIDLIQVLVEMVVEFFCNLV